MEGLLVEIDYTNWKGERARRVIEPLRLSFGSNEWHQEPQWLLEAIDVEKDCERTFALKNIHAWTTLRQRRTLEQGG